jgi:protein-tyrosine kinase
VSEKAQLRRVEENELVQIISSGPLVPAAKPHVRNLSDRTRQEFRNLVQRLFLSSYPDGPRVVVFAAVDHGNGCSWTSACIAEILADTTDRMVCLIDANFRSASAFREFRCGKLAKLSDEEWSLAPVGDATPANLRLLSYRPLLQSPTAASLEGFQLRLNNLRKDFYVLIDAPPLNGYAEAALFGRMADGLVLILAANDTRREPARKARQLLDESGIPVLGAVLNKRVFPVPEPLYRRL